jgi:cytochrome c
MRQAFVFASFVASSLTGFACTNGSTGGNRGTGGAGGGDGGASTAPAILTFSKTVGFRHDSIADGVTVLAGIAESKGWGFESSEDASVFSDTGLGRYRVVVFLSTTGDVLDGEEQAALERFVRAGGGWVGIHSASDTEYDWPFYGGLVGAYFRAHPAVQEAVVRVENGAHQSTMMLPSEWRRTDEWYAFVANPRPNVTVLLTLDESTYTPGDSGMGSDHPIAWFHAYEGGRAFYTALGHTRESYAEPEFVAHLTGALEWAAAR